jgi:hypothetical protein
MNIRAFFDFIQSLRPVKQPPAALAFLHLVLIGLADKRTGNIRKTSRAQIAHHGHRQNSMIYRQYLMWAILASDFVSIYCANCRHNY